MTRAGRVAALSAALLALAPRLALACAVCFDQSEKNRVAFLATTAFMTVLPLGMIGGAGLWLRRRFRASRGTEPAGGGPPPA